MASSCVLQVDVGGVSAVVLEHGTVVTVGAAVGAAHGAAVAHARRRAVRGAHTARTSVAQLAPLSVRTRHTVTSFCKLKTQGTHESSGHFRNVFSLNSVCVVGFLFPALHNMETKKTGEFDLHNIAFITELFMSL